MDIGADAVAVTDGFARDHFVAADDGLGSPQIDNHIAIFDSLNRTVNDLADAVFVFLIVAFAFCFAHFLDDDLFGVLRCDAAKIQWRQAFSDKIADFGFRIAAFGLLQRNLSCIILDGLNNVQQPRKFGLAGLRVNLAADIIFRAVAGFCRFLNGVFHRFNDNVAVNRFFARNGVCNLQQFQSVSANASLSHCPSIPPI